MTLIVLILHTREDNNQGTNAILRKIPRPQQKQTTTMSRKPTIFVTVAEFYFFIDLKSKKRCFLFSSTTCTALVVSSSLSCIIKS